MFVRRLVENVLWGAVRVVREQTVAIEDEQLSKACVFGAVSDHQDAVPHSVGQDDGLPGLRVDVVPLAVRDEVVSLDHLP